MTADLFTSHWGIFTQIKLRHINITNCTTLNVGRHNTIFTVLRLYVHYRSRYIVGTSIYVLKHSCMRKNSFAVSCYVPVTNLVVLAGGCNPAARLYGGRPPPTLCGRGAGRSGSQRYGSPASLQLVRLHQARFSTGIPEIYPE
jgi:hypothetical protein